MFIFREISGMLPSELVIYARELEEEITRLEASFKKTATADYFIVDGKDDQYATEQQLLDDMEVGEVVEVDSFKRINHSFKLKISQNRIDDHPDRMSAEHTKMLHSL